MPNKLAVRRETHENDTVDEAAETINETDLFTVGEVALLRGTDGLDFNILKITKAVKRKKLGPRNKIIGNFLTEQNVRDNGDRIFEENKEWKGGSMTFVHLVWDNQQNVVSVYLREEVTPENKLFIISGDTFNEMVDLSREFEQSLLEVNTDDREDILNSSSWSKFWFWFYLTKKMTIAIKRSNISSLEKGETELVEPIDIKIFLSI